MLIGVSGSSWAQDEEEKKTGWSNDAEFSYVATSGNSETSTLGFKDTAIRAWERSRFVLRAGAIRADTTVTARWAVGDLDDFFIFSESTTAKTAENYFLNGRYENKISDKFYWYAGLGWDRNRFSGIENRTVVQGGVGNIWFNREKLQFKTDYAVTYTDQEDVIQPEDADQTFAGARLTWEFLAKFGKSTKYTNDFIFDYNFEESADWRGDMINALSVSMTDMLALKISLQWLYRNEPAFGLIDVYNVSPGDPGSIVVGQVPYQLDNLDSIFQTSLVVSF
jgi:putative salt-induced outer membrane protein YdiY